MVQTELRKDADFRLTSRGRGGRRILTIADINDVKTLERLINTCLRYLNLASCHVKGDGYLCPAMVNLTRLTSQNE